MVCKVVHDVEAATTDGDRRGGADTLGQDVHFPISGCQAESVQACAKKMMSSGRAASVSAVKASSSAKNISRIRTLCIFVSARLNRLPSVLVCR
ncbi:hypothetical protein ElyMa_006688400 [Elysia marginata]|uniref:Uncharacterized protein n=1 Tax=Elysia marginata TaxID=1093978 RepID=A0AAV4IR08_9GAST|nr:hypothetical protein ElyMa_006688400 [Elysia marginata]